MPAGKLFDGREKFFPLNDVFELEKVSATIGREPAACRQLAVRAGAHVRELRTTALEIDDGKVRAIYVVRNPDKLRHLHYAGCGRKAHRLDFKRESLGRKRPLKLDMGRPRKDKKAVGDPRPKGERISEQQAASREAGI